MELTAIDFANAKRDPRVDSHEASPWRILGQLQQVREAYSGAYKSHLENMEYEDLRSLIVWPVTKVLEAGSGHKI